ncbi:hypothetical protein DFH27DRAFT_529985 [Peziza echinospora]|nr:hypothetical protein DFH27DRAFT_529985 [Peziza echinospora]
MPSRRNESDERQEMILCLDKPTKPAREVTKKPTSKPLDADSKPEFGARLVKMANTVNAGIAPAKPPHDFDTPFGLEAGPSEGTGKGKDPVTKKTTARPTPAVESKGETVAASAILAMASRPEMAKAQKYATEALAKPDGPQTTNEQMTEFLENFRVATMAYLSVDEMSEEEGTRDQDRTLMRQALGGTRRYHDEKKKRIDTPSTAFSDHRHKHKRSSDQDNASSPAKVLTASGPVTVHRGATERNPVVSSSAGSILLFQSVVI